MTINEYQKLAMTTLNPELSNYLWENTKFAPLNKDIIINIYDKSTISNTQLESAIKSHYIREFMHAKSSLKQVSIFALISY